MRSLSGPVYDFVFSLLTFKKCFPIVCPVPLDGPLRQQAIFLVLNLDSASLDDVRAERAPSPCLLV